MKIITYTLGALIASTAVSSADFAFAEIPPFETATWTPSSTADGPVTFSAPGSTFYNLSSEFTQFRTSTSNPLSFTGSDQSDNTSLLSATPFAGFRFGLTATEAFRPINISGIFAGFDVSEYSVRVTTNFDSTDFTTTAQPGSIGALSSFDFDEPLVGLVNVPAGDTVFFDVIAETGSTPFFFGFGETSDSVGMNLAPEAMDNFFEVEVGMVPEPSTYLAIATGVGLFGCVIHQRRRKAKASADA